MKPPEPSNDDARLRGTMREWRVDASLPPGFREGVWRRIESAEARAGTGGIWSTLAAAIHGLLARPALAAACVAVFLAVGLSAGRVQARNQVSRIDTSLSTRYVQSVDPFQRPR